MLKNYKNLNILDDILWVLRICNPRNLRDMEAKLHLRHAGWFDYGCDLTAENMNVKFNVSNYEMLLVINYVI